MNKQARDFSYEWNGYFGYLSGRDWSLTIGYGVGQLVLVMWIFSHFFSLEVSLLSNRSSFDSGLPVPLSWRHWLLPTVALLIYIHIMPDFIYAYAHL